MISIIAAIGKNRELGKNNQLLWHIPEDFKRFKALTSGHIVIMGRKTFESIGKPLPNRTNYIITRNKEYKAIGGQVFNSLEEAISNSKSTEEIFIIGGAEIYQQAMKYADRLYLTLVDKEYPDADAFFPDYSLFKSVIFQENHPENEPKFRFINLAK
jgi:dihydrofolate reductase